MLYIIAYNHMSVIHISSICYNNIMQYNTVYYTIIGLYIHCLLYNYKFYIYKT